MMTFEQFFKHITAANARSGDSPHAWQTLLADAERCTNRLIRIPTGMGKTLGVLSAWAYYRVHCQNTNWPTRLVWCLPMRTLVEQTAGEARKVLERAGLSAVVDVHCLMGGIDESDWYAQPEKPAILVGTQDMLLSRALNRGYAMGRAAWPRAFGIINSDALWVMDEIQLMGVGLTSSAQIQAFWEDMKTPNPEMLGTPRVTWWMSATLQPDWLSSPEVDPLLPELRSRLLTVAKQHRKGPIWDVKKPVRIEASTIDSWAEQILKAHAEHPADPKTGRQTLVVVNTVKRAKELFSVVEKQLRVAEVQPDLRLIHGRFRPFERRSWASEFLSRETLNPGVNRILIATQVVEAGVDISASCLMTELAPWPCLVQRFGRAARYGGTAQVIVLDSNPDDDKKSLPYSLSELKAAREALQQLSGVSIRELEEFEAGLADSEPDALQRLYPFQPLHVLMQHEFEELFDTSPDLSGADMDVSRFIREGDDDRDVQVFWRDWEGPRPAPDCQPLRDELCAVSIIDAKAWVKKVTTGKGLVWSWDYVEARWQTVRAESLRPGLVLLVAATVGGYDPAFGFTGEKPKRGQPSLDIHVDLESGRTSGSISATLAEIQDGSDGASISNADAEWKTIFTHCREAGEVSKSLATSLRLSARFTSLLELALRLHDWGKAHPSFASGTYRVTPTRTDLAKAPKSSWRSMAKFYETRSHGPRPGFRHELASCLATLELLRMANRSHPALQDNYSGTLQQRHGRNEDVVASAANLDTYTNAIADELCQLNIEDFNMLLYLIVSHHGKVRLSLQASPQDQDFSDDRKAYAGHGMPIRGVREGDVVPSTELPDSSGIGVQMPAVTLNLAPASIGLSVHYGASWSERIQELVSSFGPFWLGYLEAIVRTIDGRASALVTADPMLTGLSLIPSGSEESDDSSEHKSADFADDEPSTDEAELEDSNG